MMVVFLKKIKLNIIVPFNVTHYLTFKFKHHKTLSIIFSSNKSTQMSMWDSIQFISQNVKKNKTHTSLMYIFKIVCDQRLFTEFTNLWSSYQYQMEKNHLYICMFHLNKLRRAVYTALLTHTNHLVLDFLEG